MLYSDMYKKYYRCTTVVIVFVISVISPQYLYACTAAAPCTASDRIITFYVPHNSPGCRTSMEGCVETSRPGLDGQRVPRSLDDVRSGKTKYVTLASDASNYGKYFNLGTITYTSALDKQKHTVQNVVGYVHDTGGAFRGRPQKLDVNTTICQNCTDAQAGALASGRNVSFTPSNQGLVDPAGVANTGYGNVLTGNSQPGAGTAPTGVQGGSTSGVGGAPQQGSPQTQDPFTKQTGVSDTKPKNDPFIKDEFGEDVPPKQPAAKLKLRCAKGIVQWVCGSGATSARGRSKPLDAALNTRVAVRGTVTVRPQLKTTYTIECYTEKKKTESASCVVPRVIQKISERPRLVLEVSTDRIRRGGHVHVVWSARKVKQCVISGQGISGKGVAGSMDTESLLVRGVSKIQLKCKALDNTEVSAEKDIYVE